jgi:hypothetical protein
MKMEKIEIQLPFKAICINAKDKPESIPSSRWLQEGKQYTVIKVAKLMIQGGMLGFKLEELNIDEYFPYQFFAAHRFGIPVNQLWDVESELEQLLKEAKEEYEHAEIHEPAKAD